ncbi:MAG: glycerate kinase type-2 family protein [Alphaproteobacteria bacterium]
MTPGEITTLLKQSIEAVLKVSMPDPCLKNHIPEPPTGKLIVIGAGKAAAEMARVFEKNYEGELSGVVVTRYGHAVKTKRIKVMEAAHPIPDLECVNAVDEIIKTIHTANRDDLIVCLLSGGGSSLLTAPIDRIKFETVRNICMDLLHSGADITEMNTLRKHLNRALGGGLALEAQTTPMLTLSISDVNGNIPSVIASGPTVPDETTLKDCWDVLKKYGITPDYTIEDALNNPNNETAKEHYSIFSNKIYELIATPEKSLEAAEKFWKEQGFHVHNLGASIDGNTNIAAKKQIELINALPQRPLAIISGGETTVKVTGEGKGGPNTQFVLQAAIALNGHENTYVMAYDTDGIDGSEDNGGAICTPDTLKRAKENNIDPNKFLRNNDSYSFFKTLDDLIITGPTHTNVNDYRVVLVL